VSFDPRKSEGRSRAKATVGVAFRTAKVRRVRSSSFDLPAAISLGALESVNKSSVLWCICALRYVRSGVGVSVRRYSVRAQQSRMRPVTISRLDQAPARMAPSESVGGFVAELSGQRRPVHCGSQGDAVGTCASPGESMQHGPRRVGARGCCLVSPLGTKAAMTASSVATLVEWARTRIDELRRARRLPAFLCLGSINELRLRVR
jgi:hypothetical protein